MRKFLQVMWKNKMDVKLLTQKFNKLRERIYRNGAKLLVLTLYQVRFEGFEKIPASGGALLISNHVTYMDGLLIDAAVKRPVRYVIDSYIYKWPGVHHFMKLYNAIPIEAKRDSIAAALDAAEVALKNGELVFIFPEGQLTYTGNMSRFRFGAEWMAKRAPVPVYPIAIKGLWGSIFSRKYRRSKWKFIPRSFRRKVILKCGDPIPHEKAKISYMQQKVMRLKNSIEL